MLNPEVEVPGSGSFSQRRGRWQSEVSALVFDAQAPAQARWKLFWHQYLNIGGDRKFKHGWLAYKEAATAEGLASAKPIKLFAGAAYDTVSNDAASWTHSPIAGPPVNWLQKLGKDLAQCVIVSEPGVLAKPDALYLSLTCFRPKLFGLMGATNSTVLLKCARPCNAAAPDAWAFAGTVLTQADAESLGFEKFSASDLFSHNGGDFIVVSPAGKRPVDSAYNGCAVFRFADLAGAKVAREAGGRPQLEAFTNLMKDTFNGACAFLPVGPNKGLLIGRIDFAKENGKPNAWFRIVRTGIVP